MSHPDPQYDLDNEEKYGNEGTDEFFKKDPDDPDEVEPDEDDDGAIRNWNER